MEASSTGATKEQFQVRAELYAAARFPPKVYDLYRTRALVTDVIAKQCWLMVLAITKTHELLGRELPRIGIIGGGHMGCAIAMALLKNQYPSDRLLISTRQPDRVPKCDALANPAHQSLFQTIPRCYDNARLSKESEIIILCMPPSQLKSVAIQIKHALSIAHSPCVVVSVLCGVASETIQKACGTKLVIRTQIHFQALSDRVVTNSDDQKEIDQLHNPESTSASPVLMTRHDTQSIAIEHLVRSAPLTTSPLATVLHDLACRLSRSGTASGGASQASETVATVLCGREGSQRELSRHEETEAASIDNTSGSTSRATDDPASTAWMGHAVDPEEPGPRDVEEDAQDPPPAIITCTAALASVVDITIRAASTPRRTSSSVGAMH